MHRRPSRTLTAITRALPTVHTVTDALTYPAGVLCYLVAATWVAGLFGVDLARTLTPSWVLVAALAGAGVVSIVAGLTEPTTDEPADCC